MDFAQFEEVIRNVLHPDNAVRRAAELEFNKTKAQSPALLVAALLELLSTSADELVRTSCAVLARRQLSSLYPKLPADSQAATKAALLACLQREPVGAVRRKVCDAVALLGAELLEADASAWPQLSEQLLLGRTEAHAGAEALHARLVVLGELAWALIVPRDGLDPAAAEHARGRLLELCACALGPAQPAAVRAEGLAALEAALLAASEGAEEDEAARPALTAFVARARELFPAAMSAVESLLGGCDECAALRSLEGLVSVATSAPAFFEGAAQQLVQAMMAVVESSQLPSAARQLGVEAVVSLCEAGQHIVASELGAAPLAAAIVPLLARLMVRAHGCADVAEWAAAHAQGGDADEGEEAEAELASAREAAHRLGEALGGEALAPALLRALAELGASAAASDGADGAGCLHAALTLLGWCAEACADQLAPTLPQLLAQLVGPGAAHAHPRVRWAALDALGLLCDTPLGLPLCDARAHGAQCVATVGGLLADAEPAVARHAARVLCGVCVAAGVDETGSVLDEAAARNAAELLAPAAAQLGARLLPLLAPGAPAGVAHAATDAAGLLGTAAGADALGEARGALLRALSERIHAPAGSARAAAIEAAGALSATSAALAATDGCALLGALPPLLAEAEARGADDLAELHAAAYAAAAHVARALGASIEPSVLGAALGRALSAAAAPVEVRVETLSEEEAAAAEEAEEGDEEGAGALGGWTSTVLKCGGGVFKRVCVNEAGAEAKQAALCALHTLAEHTGAAFWPHAARAMAVLMADEEGCAPGCGLAGYKPLPAVRRDAAFGHAELNKAAAAALRAGAASAAEVCAMAEASARTLGAQLAREQDDGAACAQLYALKEIVLGAHGCGAHGVGLGAATLNGCVLEPARAVLRRSAVVRTLATTAKQLGAAAAAKAAGASASAAAAAGASAELLGAEAEGAGALDEGALGVLEEAAELVCALLRCHGLDGLACAEGVLLPALVSLLSADDAAVRADGGAARLRAVGACVVRALLEGCAPHHAALGAAPAPSGAGAAPRAAPLGAEHAASKYVHAALPALLAMAAPPERHAAAAHADAAAAALRALGAAAERGGKLLTNKACAQGAAAALGWLQRPGAFDRTCHAACSAATLALGSLLACRGRALPESGGALLEFGRALPQLRALEDVPCGARLLCALAEGEEAGRALAGALEAQGDALLPCLLAALARTLGACAADDAPLCARAGALAKRLADGAGSERLAALAAAGALSAEQQQLLATAVAAAN